MNLYFILSLIIHYYFSYFVAQICSGLAVESSFSWLLCLFEILPSSCCILILEHFFTVLPVQNAASSSCIFSEQS